MSTRKKSTRIKDEPDVMTIKLSRSPSPELYKPTASTHRASSSKSTTYEPHPADIEYLLTPNSWSKSKTMQFLITHAFSVPPRPSHRTYFTAIELASGEKVIIPSVYRIPVLFLGAFLWDSVRLVLQADEAQRSDKKSHAKKGGEWEEFRVGIVHVARISEAFLNAARREGELDGDDEKGADDAAGESAVQGEDSAKGVIKDRGPLNAPAHLKGKGMARMWRCEMFDRVLVRYKLGWLISEPSQLKEFWENFGDEEYRKDPVKTDWKRITTKGVKGFKLTEAQIDEGITINQFVDGLKEIDGDWVWDEPSGRSSRSTKTYRKAYAFVEGWRKHKTWGKDVRWTTVLPPLPVSAAKDDSDIEMLDGENDGGQAPHATPEKRKHEKENTVLAEKNEKLSKAVEKPKVVEKSKVKEKVIDKGKGKAKEVESTTMVSTPIPAANAVDPSTFPTTLPLPATVAPANEIAGLFKLKRINQTPFPLPPPPSGSAKGKAPATAPLAPYSASASTSSNTAKPVGYVYIPEASSSAARYTSGFSWAPSSSTFQPQPYKRGSFMQPPPPSASSASASGSGSKYYRDRTTPSTSISTQKAPTHANPYNATPSVSVPMTPPLSPADVPAVVQALATQDWRVAALEAEVAELRRKVLVREGKRRHGWGDATDGLSEDGSVAGKKRKRDEESNVAVGKGAWWTNPLGHLSTEVERDESPIVIEDGEVVQPPPQTPSQRGSIPPPTPSDAAPEVLPDVPPETPSERAPEPSQPSPPQIIESTPEPSGRESSIASSVDGILPSKTPSARKPVPKPSEDAAVAPPRLEYPLDSPPKPVAPPAANGSSMAAQDAGGTGSEESPMDVDSDSPPPGLVTLKAGPAKNMRKWG